MQVSKNTQSDRAPEGLSTSEVVGMSVGIPFGVFLVVLIILLWAVVTKKCCFRESKHSFFLILIFEFAIALCHQRRNAFRMQ